MKEFKIGNKKIGADNPVFITVDISANHLGDKERAKELVKKACECGVDAVKIQTYTPSTMTLNSEKDPFQVKVNDAWKDRTLYNLYEEAFTPWEWHKELEEVSLSFNIPLFSTAYDDSSVDYLEKMNTPCYKIASFEVTDLELLKKVAMTKKPVIISRGLSNLKELELALKTLKESGVEDIVLLHCISSYPSKIEEANLKTVADIEKRFNVIPGLSDHSLTTCLPVAAVALGAKVIEKHFTLQRSDGGVDANFSLEPEELKRMIKEIREVEKALGKVSYEVGQYEIENKQFRRSLWVIKPIKKGEILTKENIGRFRPESGLPIRCLKEVLNKRAKTDISFATPLSWDLIEK